jgi:hypothetical protein
MAYFFGFQECDKLATMHRNNWKTVQDLKSDCDVMRTEQTQLRHRLQDELDKKLDLQRQLSELQRAAVKDKRLDYFLFFPYYEFNWLLFNLHLFLFMTFPLDFDCRTIQKLESQALQQKEVLDRKFVSSSTSSRIVV